MTNLPPKDELKRPHSCVVFWQDGRATRHGASHNPVDAEDYAFDHVARDPRVIRRIEVHDHEGCVETIWDAAWPYVSAENAQ